MKSVVLLMIASMLYGQTSLSPIIIEAILDNECLKLNGTYMYYFVRINDNKEVINKLKAEGLMHKKKPIIICYTQDACVNTVKALEAMGIYNIDMGPFQLNRIYNKEIAIKDAFDLEKAKEYVNRRIMKDIKKYGYSWETIARYHSSRPKRNRAYYKRLYKKVYGAKNYEKH